MFASSLYLLSSLEESSYSYCEWAQALVDDVAVTM